MSEQQAIFHPSRAVAMAKLSEFMPRTGRAYRERRNFDYGPGRHTAVSGLSPYVRHRVLSATEVLDQVLAQHARSSAEKFIDEVFWRAYRKGWLEHRPAVWKRYLAELTNAHAEIEAPTTLHDVYANAKLGQTGIESFDAWTQELVHTGYLPNHARMWFASL